MRFISCSCTRPLSTYTWDTPRHSVTSSDNVFSHLSNGWWPFQREGNCNTPPQRVICPLASVMSCPLSKLDSIPITTSLHNTTHLQLSRVPGRRRSAGRERPRRWDGTDATGFLWPRDPIWGRRLGTRLEPSTPTTQMRPCNKSTRP